jgi:hypothetical protein
VAFDLGLVRFTNAVTFITESRGSPVATAGRNTLPDIAANPVLDVMTAATTVASGLALYDCDWTTIAGRRLAGRVPTGSPRSTQ